jgi:hypothetical protein
MTSNYYRIILADGMVQNYNDRSMSFVIKEYTWCAHSVV